MERNVVLYAEDDYDDFDLLKEIFFERYPDILLIHATRGTHLLHSLEDEQIRQRTSLVILDNNMPELDDKQTLVAIRTNPAYNHIPVVIFSTTLRPQEIVFFESMGAHCFRKAVKIEELEALVEKFRSLRLQSQD
jgi:two-component system response regulator